MDTERRHADVVVDATSTEVIEVIQSSLLILNSQYGLGIEETVLLDRARNITAALRGLGITFTSDLRTSNDGVVHHQADHRSRNM